MCVCLHNREILEKEVLLKKKKKYIYIYISITITVEICQIVSNIIEKWTQKYKC